jgi:outer membrane biosynthesis protein TonB
MGPSPPKRSDRLFSPASAEERARVGKRLLWALPIAAAVLVLFALLGPDAETIDRKFTPYGARGPLRIMPEISIENRADPVHRRPATETTRPPAAPNYQVEPEDIAPDQEEVTPPPKEETSRVRGTGDTDSDVPESEVSVAEAGDANVAMDLPTQTADSDFIIRKLVRPLYPAGVSDVDRARPLITVQAAFYLNEKAEIVALIIQSNDGGPEFADEVRQAMERWEFEPRLRDGQSPRPRWLVVTWRFRSPFSP